MLICIEECDGESDKPKLPNIGNFPHHVLPPGAEYLGFGQSGTKSGPKYGPKYAESLGIRMSGSTGLAVYVSVRVCPPMPGSVRLRT
jgi:hypothetical protein